MDLPAQDIADVFQEVFQAVALHFDKFQRNRPGDTFRGWLRTITKNKIRDHFRSKERQPQAAGGSEGRMWWAGVPDRPHQSAEEGNDQDTAHYLFRQALELIKNNFEESTWRAFWSVVVEGRLPHDVAGELGISPGAVRVAKCRVLHRLRQELGDLPHEL
jgi:RNA polymerase sigma-70 factor (ECF subfamily)